MEFKGLSIIDTDELIKLKKAKKAFELLKHVGSNYFVGTSFRGFGGWQNEINIIGETDAKEIFESILADEAKDKSSLSKQVGDLKKELETIKSKWWVRLFL